MGLASGAGIGNAWLAVEFKGREFHIMKDF